MKKTLKAYARYLVQCLIKMFILNTLVSQIRFTMNIIKHVITYTLICKLCSPEQFPHLLTTIVLMAGAITLVIPTWIFRSMDNIQSLGCMASNTILDLSTWKLILDMNLSRTLRSIQWHHPLLHIKWHWAMGRIQAHLLSPFLQNVSLYIFNVHW